MPDGSILGIGMNNTLFTLPILPSAWINIPNTGAVKSVTPMPDGTLLGIGMDNTLVERTMPMPANVEQSVDQHGQQRLRDRRTQMPDETLLGIGMTNKLYEQHIPAGL